MNNKVVETTATAANNPAVMEESAFKALLQGAIGLSPLATGEKFSTDDLVEMSNVTLWDYDWVDYTEGEGTRDEKYVRFALWKVTAERDGVTVDGYYQGGTILNKLAATIQTNNAGEELRKYGVKIKVEWGKTNAKNDIALITII